MTSKKQYPPPGGVVGSEGSKLTRRDVCVLSIILLFLILLFSNALFGDPERCLGRPQGDARSQFYSWRAYAFNEVSEGRFPLWNPYEFLGMPFVASLQSAMFYPTTWLCAFLPVGVATNLGIMLGLFLSALFTYLWARRVGISWVGATIAASAYTFAAPQFLRIFEGHWSFLGSMTWIPCTLLCVECLFSSRAKPVVVACGAGAVAMQLFGGNPQYALYGGVATLLYFLVRLLQERRHLRIFRIVSGFVAMYVLGVVLASVQLVPALEFLSLSSRQGQLSLAWISQYSLVPESLITLIVPDFFGSDLGAEYWGRFNLWEMSAYVGVTTVALACMALRRPRRRLCLPLCGLAMLMLLLALGKYTFLQAVFYHAAPGFNLFRVWARFLCPFALFVGMLAGMGADRLLDPRTEADLADLSATRPARPQRWRWVLTSVAALLILSGAVLVTELAPVRSGWTKFMEWVLQIAPVQRLYLSQKQMTLEWASEARHAAGLGMLRSGLLLGGVAVVAWLLKWRPQRRRLLAVLLLGIIGVDVFLFCRGYLQTFDPEDQGFTPGVKSFLAQQDQPFRYARGRSLKVQPADGMMHQVASLEGIQPNAPAHFRDVFWAFQGRPKSTQTTFYILRTMTPSHRMLNLRYLIQLSDHPRARIPGMHTVYEDERFRIDELPDPWPRCWLVHDADVVENPDEMLALLPGLGYEESALLEKPLDVAPAPQGDAVEEPPRITWYESNRVRIEAEPASDALLVLSDMHYPGWEATVDGRPTTIHRVNYLMRGVSLTAGKHVVEFRYRPKSFRLGVAMSLCGCGIIAVLVIWHLVHRRKRDLVAKADDTTATG